MLVGYNILNNFISKNLKAFLIIPNSLWAFNTVVCAFKLFFPSSETMTPRSIYASVTYSVMRSDSVYVFPRVVFTEMHNFVFF